MVALHECAHLWTALAMVVVLYDALIIGTAAWLENAAGSTLFVPLNAALLAAQLCNTSAGADSQSERCSHILWPMIIQVFALA